MVQALPSLQASPFIAPEQSLGVVLEAMLLKLDGGEMPLNARTWYWYPTPASTVLSSNARVLRSDVAMVAHVVVPMGLRWTSKPFSFGMVGFQVQARRTRAGPCAVAVRPLGAVVPTTAVRVRSSVLVPAPAPL